MLVEDKFIVEFHVHERRHVHRLGAMKLQAFCEPVVRSQPIVAMLTEGAIHLGQNRFGRSAGAVITSVEPGSLASDANLEAGTLITKVDATRVKSADEAQNALEKASLARGILLQVQFR